MSSASMEREPGITTDHALGMPEISKKETVDKRLSKFVKRIIENAQRNSRAEKRRAELARREEEGDLFVRSSERYLGQDMHIDSASQEDLTSL